MPIRTNRGRAAVYRRLWGWPLRSPRHFTTTLVLLAVVIIGVGILLPDSEPLPEPDPRTTGSSQLTNPGAPTSGTRAFAAPTTSTHAPVTSFPQAAPPPAAPAPEALAIAESWGKAWVDHPDGTTSQQWLDKLKPFTTDEYLGQLASVDPRMVPSSKVTGKPSSISATTSSVEVKLPTDKIVLRLTVITTAAGWRVASYTEAD
ncbi:MULTISPECIES: hypothetical protein [unclassified Crossiella]|uniref:hypothetical protein n=1 Tax=unclassified Crossiella TaxID=2620835 RepID=UPI001FFFE6A9|nr:MULTISPECIES: hypothetical protein [unclassified Crossiella]MCK2240764.1 hypothetical protein [Crossiella sp. S99.2]MCK2254092.1 hypothetical protein [Crossiella sp. S99.1]